MNTYIVVINLNAEPNQLRESLSGIHKALKAICDEVSGPIFNSKDAKDFALFVRSEISSDQLAKNLENGCAATNHKSPLSLGDNVLICEIGEDSWARGFSSVWKFLRHQKPGF